MFTPKRSNFDSNNDPRSPLCGVVSVPVIQDDKQHISIAHTPSSLHRDRSSVSLSNESLLCLRSSIPRRNGFSNHADSDDQMDSVCISKRSKAKVRPQQPTINGCKLRSHGPVTCDYSNGTIHGNDAPDAEMTTINAGRTPVVASSSNCLQKSDLSGKNDNTKFSSHSTIVSLPKEVKTSSNSITHTANILPRNKEKIERLIRRPGKCIFKSPPVVAAKCSDEPTTYFTSIFSPDSTITRSKSKSIDIQIVKVNSPVRNKSGLAPIKHPTSGYQVHGGLCTRSSNVPISSSYPTLLSPNGTNTMNISVEYKTRNSFSELDLSSENTGAGGTASARLQKGEDLLTSNNVIVALDMKADDEAGLSLCGGQSLVVQERGDTMEAGLRRHRVASITIETKDEEDRTSDGGLEVGCSLNGEGGGEKQLEEAIGES